MHAVWKVLMQYKRMVRSLWTAGNALYGLCMAGSMVNVLVTAGPVVHTLWTEGGVSLTFRRYTLSY